MSAKPDPLLVKIENILRKEFKRDTVDVSPSGVRNNIHVIVVSGKFDRMTEQEKQEHLWGLLEDGGLGKRELTRISMVLPLSVAELKR